MKRPAWLQLSRRWQLPDWLRLGSGGSRMPGAWRRQRYSLRRRLIGTTLLSSLVCGLACVVMVMVIAWNETSDTFDSALEEGARMTLSLGAAMARNDALDVDDERLRVDQADKRGRLYYQLVNNHGDVLRRARGAPDKPFVETSRRNDHYYNVWADGTLWRVYVLQHDDLDLDVQIGQHWDDRNELLSETIEELAWPALALWLALGIINWWVIRRLLSPLEHAAQAIAAKSPDDLTPVPNVGQATEVAAILTALNTVLARLSGALTAERRFTADAAHELRTPLAALGSKIQLMQRRYRDAAPGDWQSDLQDLRTDLARSTALVENLLLLARLDPQAADELPKERIDLDTLLREVTAACTPAAQARAMTIHLDAAGSKSAGHGLHANRQLLFSALRNLVDNGVRYGSNGGRVLIEVQSSLAYTRFSVCDDGPGVPPPQRARLTQRFYRQLGNKTPGNGLGLSIVEQIVALHGGRLDFGDGLDGRGLGVHLQLPNAPPPFFRG